MKQNAPLTFGQKRISRVSNMPHWDMAASTASSSMLQDYNPIKTEKSENSMR